MIIGEEEFYTYEQLASKLDVKRSTLQKWVYKGYIPSTKVGKTRYFGVTAITEWLKAKTEI